MDKERRGNYVGRATKTIYLGEFVEGPDSKLTGHRYLAISEGDGESAITTFYSALSWGNDYRNFEAERSEVIIARILKHIEKQYNCGSLEAVLQLLTDKGNEGVDLTLSYNSWSRLHTENTHLRAGQTMNIPKPPPLKI